MSSPIWITPAGSLGVIPDEEFYQFILSVYDSSQSPLPVSGTLTFSNIQTNPADRNEKRRVIGSGTSFTSELEVGDRLINEHDVVLGIVGEIISNTELLLFQDATFSATGVSVRSSDNITFLLISGSLPTGLHIDQFGNMSGVPINGEIEGVPAAVAVVTVSEFTIRAVNRHGAIADRTFSLTVAGVNPITVTPKNTSLGMFFDGDLFSYQLIANNYRPDSTVTWTVDAVNLPPGVSLSSTGLLRGYILPSSVTAGDESSTYSFKVSVTDGYTIDTSNYTITVYNRSLFTADASWLTADETDLDVTVTKQYTPVLYNFDASLPAAKQGNYYAFQFVGVDFNEDQIVYTISEDSEDSLPTGLTLNPDTGWVYGVVPFGPLSVTEYNITVRIGKATPGLTEFYMERSFTLPVVSQVSNSTVWLTDRNLGVIDNGAVSTFAVSAYTPSNRPLQYQLVDGELPSGLSLAVDGLIIGRVGFESFFLDGGTTTFMDGTTIDQTHTFTVEAYSSDLLVVDQQEFQITVNAVNTKPYDNLYIRAMPTREQRLVYKQIINNTDIFPPADIYRPSDPWFGKNQELRSLFLTGLNSSDPANYVTALLKNHYLKALNYSAIKTAQSLNSNLEVEYEVVYLDLVDQSTNLTGVSAPLAVPLPTNSVPGLTTAYPNSFKNMEERITTDENIGYANKSILPTWMTSRQESGVVLGFVHALVLCYTKPGKSAEVAYRVSQRLDDLRLVEYTIDRYEWDLVLSANYNTETGEYRKVWVAPVYHTLSPGVTVTDASTNKYVPDVTAVAEFTGFVDTGMTYLKYPDVAISTNLTAGE